MVAHFGGRGMTVLQAQNMSLVLIDQQDRVRGLVGGMGKSHTDWPAGCRRTATGCC